MKTISILCSKKYILPAVNFSSLIFTRVLLILAISLSLICCKKSVDVNTLSPNQVAAPTSASFAAAAPLKPVTTCLFKGFGGYCTDGAWEIKGKCIPWTGAAKDWYANAKAAGYTQSQTAIAGAIVVFPGDPINGNQGHVGVMVDATTMWSMNDICGRYTWTKRKVSAYPNSKKTIKPLGYIIDYKTNSNSFPLEKSNCTKK